MGNLTHTSIIESPKGNSFGYLANALEGFIVGLVGCNKIVVNSFRSLCFSRKLTVFSSDFRGYGL